MLYLYRLGAPQLIDDEYESDDDSVNSTDFAQSIRDKDPQIRSRDERRFIGIDIILNPQAYASLSITEAEEMQFDPDYQCELTKLKLQKIVHLPENICLAAPFLHSQLEFDVHRILNKILKGYDDEYFRDVDAKSGDSRGTTMSGKEDDDSGDEEDFTHKLMKAHGVKGSEIANAEAVMDILTREARRNRLRGMGPGDKFTPEEVEARAECLFENYATTLEVEATTLLEMIRTGVEPAVAADLKIYSADSPQYVYTPPHPHIHTHARTHAHAHVHAHTHTHTQAHTHTRTHVTRR